MQIQQLTQDAVKISEKLKHVSLQQVTNNLFKPGVQLENEPKPQQQGKNLALSTAQPP